jgi:AraC-like DNA-binding protein
LSVAAFLLPRLLAHVKHVFADEDELLIATSWEELESFIRRKPVRVVMLDPSADGRINIPAVEGLLKRYPSLPLMAYVTQTAPAFAAVAQLSKMGLEDVVLQRFDDAPEQFRDRVEHVQGNSLTRKVNAGLGPGLKELPRRLTRTIEKLFAQPHRYATSLDVAMEAGMSTISVYRSLEEAQLGSPKRLIIAAKVLRGFGYLRDPGYSVLDVSMKLGYKAARIFSHHWVSVFGLAPARIRTRLTDEVAVERVLRWIKSSDDSALPELEGLTGSSSRRRRNRKREPD